MLPVTRWFIKAGMIWLALGLMLLLADTIPGSPFHISLLPVYWHMIAVGWITQLIMGVSIWMFPRKRRDRKKAETPLQWAIFWSLNAGLVLRFFSEPLLDPGAVEAGVAGGMEMVTNLEQGIGLVSWLVLTSIGLQLTAVLLYLAEIWPRVQPRRKRKGSN